MPAIRMPRRAPDGKLYANLKEDIQPCRTKDWPGCILVAQKDWLLIRTVADAQLDASAPVGVGWGTQ